MRAGLLREEGVIYSLPASATADAYGDPIVTLTPFASVRCGLYPLTGREYFAAKATESEHSVKIRMRYIAGVTPQMRIVVRNVTYLIESVANVAGKHRELELIAKADTGNV